MGKSKIDKIVAIMGILMFLVFLILGKLTGVTEYMLDNVLFIAFIIFFYITYDKWNLSTPVFAFFILSLIPHSLGIYGFYFISPFSFIQWDHITHFFPMMASSMIFFRFLQQFMDKKFFRLKTLFLVAIVLLAALGVGTFVEKFEYLGFVVNGFGEGGAAFGTGDACEGQLVTSIEQIDEFGGGWFNTMGDLMWNFYGALIGVILMSIANFYGKREEIDSDII